jgi:hypothetical protein
MTMRVDERPLNFAEAEKQCESPLTTYGNRCHPSCCLDQFPHERSLYVERILHKL